jgi:hypothetical protein
MLRRRHRDADPAARKPDADSVPVRLQASDFLGNEWDDPSEELLWQIISGLTFDGNQNLCLLNAVEDSVDGIYVQTAVLPDGRFTVEYQDGDLHHHYQAKVDNARRAYEVVVAWASNSPGWREMLPWERMMELG